MQSEKVWSHLAIRCLSVFLLAQVILTSARADAVTPFTARLDQSGIIRQGIMGTSSIATAEGQFLLTQPAGNPGATTLAYTVQFSGVDLDGNQTPSLLDDVTAIHFHDIHACIEATCLPGDTVGTHHLLNVYGFPAQHDADLIVDAVHSRISGIWDDSDATVGQMHSHPISDMATLDALFHGNVMLIVHTNQVPTGAIAGHLQPVPEPCACIIWIAWIPSLWRRPGSFAGTFFPPSKPA